ncbi:helix-turn-helix domain-containing protein [Herbaspirillum lusitanum]|uniref:helix-turn-helix domain-containing protein n=1 Tax=Herbaspirillum lusitanum TaxID=213312 RepID=UPI000A046D4A
MDRLESMAIFLAVVDEGGFAAAARKMKISPPVVTRAVSDLEAAIGVRLLTRTTRHRCRCALRRRLPPGAGRRQRNGRPGRRRPRRGARSPGGHGVGHVRPHVCHADRAGIPATLSRSRSRMPVRRPHHQPDGRRH